MSFEDRLRTDLHRAASAMPTGPVVDLSATVASAKRAVRVQMGALAAATAVAVAGIIVGVDALRTRDRTVIPPVMSPSEEASPTPSSSVTSCSATGMSPYLEDQDLPTAIAELRIQIVERALECDYFGLEYLALRGDEPFTHSFGEGGSRITRISPAAFWARAERRGEDPLRKLVQILNTDFCIEEVSDGSSYYFWPSVMCSDAMEEDRRELERSGIYSKEELRLFEEFGSYIGYRVGIRSDGDWMSFVAGD